MKSTTISVPRLLSAKETGKTISGPRLLSAKETAKTLGVTIRTLHTYTAQKYLKRVKIGNRNQYDIDDVRAFIESHKTCS